MAILLIFVIPLCLGRQVGAPLVAKVNEGDDNEDRKRLKEKLKASV